MELNIADWIERWSRATPDKLAVRYGGVDLTYAQFNEAIVTHARGLRSGLGIRAGDRVAYLGQNHPQTLISLFACARLGALLVPLNWRLSTPEQLHLLQDSGASAVLVDPSNVDALETVRTMVPDCRFVVIEGKALSGWQHLADLDRSGEGDDREPGSGAQSPVLIIYTSGTTGFPKGAVLTQEALQYNAYNSSLLHDMTSNDVVMSTLPLFHVGGLNVQTTTAFYRGASVILHRVFDPQQVLHCIRNDRPTLTIILPAHMPALRAIDGWETADVSCLRGVLTGSCIVPEDMGHYWHARGVPLLNMFGASETAPIAIHQSVSNAAVTAGTVGFPAMHCEIRIVDDAGQDCATGEPGEILVRGKNVMIYYWNNVDATRSALVDGWFHTGDIGYVDRRGCYRVVDRKKDMIISGGENIYPVELENVLISHPDVLEASVVGRVDARWGEVPVAIVVPRPGSQLDKEAILGWFDGKLGRYKHPKDVMFVDALPRNPMNKVVKKTLRKLVEGHP